jgi:hypothetical protein
MKIIPLDLKPANEFVEQFHRHNKRVVTHKFSIGLECENELVGVAIASRPIARMLDDGKTLEVRRVCVKDQHKNACSKLLARVKRIGQLMGYEKVITYTLQKESGSSLKAIKAKAVAEVKGGQWNRKDRPSHFQAVCDEKKYRWEL